MASIGYTASVSRTCSIDRSRSRTCRASRLRRSPSGAINTLPATARSTRRRSSFPTRSSHRADRCCRLPGALGAATIARQNTLFPYPLLIGSNAAVDRSGATADYHAMVLRVSRRFSGGVMMDATCTWSKEIDNTDNMEDNQNFNAGGGARQQSQPHRSDAQSTAWLQRRAAPAGRNVPL